MKTHEKLITLSFGVLVIVLLTFGLFKSTEVLKETKEVIVKEATEVKKLGSFSTAPQSINGNSSTSSPTFLVGTATSTFSIESEGAEAIDLNFFVIASSTASNLVWYYQFSNNDIDWYGEDTKTVNSDILTTHGASTTVHQWKPGTV